jgi:hypothetical protein
VVLYAYKYDWQCVLCPAGAICTGNTRWSDVISKPGYRQMSYDNHTFGKCLNIAACSNTTHASKHCKYGHGGELCSTCLPAFATLSRSQPCEPCEDETTVSLTFIAAILIAVAVFAFLVWDNLDGARDMIPKRAKSNSLRRVRSQAASGITATESNQEISMPFHTIAIRIVSSYMQIAGLLLTFQLTLPESVQVLISIESGASSLGERLLMFECLTDNRNDYDLFVLREITMVWLIPFVSVVCCVLFWFVLFRRKWSKDGFVSSLMVLFYTLFPSVVTKIALTLSCREFGDRSLLSEALSVQCWSNKHLEIIAGVGLPGFFLYVVIIPTGLARLLILRRRQETLYYHQKHFDPTHTLRYGFVFAGYREGYEWWESMIMLRKFLFVVLSIFLRLHGTTSQVIATSMVLSASLSLQLQYQPFADDDHNRLESIGLHACLLQLLVALLCNSIGREVDSDTLDAMSTAVVIVVMFGSSFGFFWWTGRLTIQSSHGVDGVFGYLAKCCGRCCGTKTRRIGTGSSRGSEINTKIRPLQQKSDAHVYAALKIRKQIKSVVGKQLNANNHIQVAENIQKKHVEHRDMHTTKIQKNQLHARMRLTARIQNRSKQFKQKRVADQDEDAERNEESLQIISIFHEDGAEDGAEDSAENGDDGGTDLASEMEAIRQSIASVIRKPKRLNKVFAKIDKDKSKTIDEKEFQVLVEVALKKTKREMPNDFICGLIWSSLFGEGTEEKDVTLEVLQKWLFGK